MSSCKFDLEKCNVKLNFCMKIICNVVYGTCDVPEMFSICLLLKGYRTMCLTFMNYNFICNGPAIKMECFNLHLSKLKGDLAYIFSAYKTVSRQTVIIGVGHLFY